MEKEMIKVLITDDSANNGVRLASRLRELGVYAYTRRADASIVCTSVMRDCPDVVVTDLEIPDIDPIKLMSRVRAMTDRVPEFIVISDVRNSFIERQLIENGAAYFLKKPFEADELLSAVRAVSRRAVLPDCRDIEILVTDMIHRLGVPAHIKGFHYLRSAILGVVEHRELMECITKQLYPVVANQYDTTSSRVERAIRHAIEIAWERGDSDAISSFFGYSVDNYRGRPTNSEFIALVSDKLRLQMKTAPSRNCTYSVLS